LKEADETLNVYGLPVMCAKPVVIFSVIWNESVVVPGAVKKNENVCPRLVLTSVGTPAPNEEYVGACRSSAKSADVNVLAPDLMDTVHEIISLMRTMEVD